MLCDRVVMLKAVLCDKSVLCDRAVMLKAVLCDKSVLCDRAVILACVKAVVCATLFCAVEL